ncbi:hypothetical protein F2P56_014082 [Juglans regia]|uniref:Uncharacterized protein n=2 Tax=Juglans regia TaxID=51240 RepID=A0A833XCK1_JUGRE|nr:uncharacterized protein LOC108995291 [Juglans regia]KAF5463963.1 hypothetical protein F2P56_014082 [Juglans regia]
MGRFREALEMGGLFDLGWKGDKYTWSNKHGDETFTKERLDRAVANIRWKRMFKEGWVEVLAARCSDHRPILLYVNQKFSSERKRKRLFRYEAKWSLEEDCEEVIKRAWQVKTMGRDTEKDLQLLLEDSREAFQSWSRKITLDKGRLIKEKTERLKKLQEDEGSHNMMEIKKIQEEIGTCLEMEDLKWRQRAKLDWYIHGD